MQFIWSEGGGIAVKLRDQPFLYCTEIRDSHILDQPVGVDGFCRLYHQGRRQREGRQPSDLEKKAAAASDRFHSLSDKIKGIEGAIHTNAELKAASVDYAKTRPVFDGYKATKYSRKYLAEHEAEIKLYRDAQATFRRILNGAKLPKMDALKAEWQTLTAEKSAAYQAYKAAKKDMQDLVTAKANIDHLLGLTGGSKNKEQERERV